MTVGETKSDDLAVGGGLRAGSLVASYTLGRKLGEGEMGEVHQATSRDGTEVAIKLLRLAAAGPELEKRFRREALLCAALTHPNIVSVSDHGIHRGSPFFVMSMLRGNDLERCVTSTGPLRPDVAVAIMLQVCAGIRHAHEAGIIHRDLKPANVFLDERGDEITAVVCDFGVAKVYDEDGALTASGAVLGTPLFMAPEQLLDSKRVDARCDVWALGMLLYHALAGRAAFENVTSLADLVFALHECRVPPLQDRAPWVPPALARIVHAALLPVDKRIGSIRELEDALLRTAGAKTAVKRSDLVPLSDARRSQIATRATLPADSTELRLQGDDTVLGDNPSDPALRDTNIGRTLGARYRIVAKIGSGGMGAVYEAIDNSPGTGPVVVAVKVMTQEVGSRGVETIRRFLREAKASARIDSPYVTRFLDTAVDAATGSPFIVMERLRGIDLASQLALSGALEPEPAVALFLQACDALRAAHALGIVHRDIKPSNLFLHEEGATITLKICDFGIAKQLTREDDVGASTELTRTGGLIGSPLYMSPEQAKSSKNVDERSDVFSLALTMHEALSGERPWRGRSSMGEIIVAVCTEDVPSLTSIAPWVDPALAAVIAKALCRDVGGRYATIGEMAAALAPFGALRVLASEDLVGVPSARRASVVRSSTAAATHIDAKVTGDAVSVTASQVPRRARRWPVVAALGLALAGAGGTAFAIRSKSPSNPAPAADVAPPTTASLGALGSSTVATPVTPVTSTAAQDAKPDAGPLPAVASSAPPVVRAAGVVVRRPPIDAPAPKPSARGAATTAAPAQTASSVGRGFTATDLPP
jgi:serine/threonine-protein kinase